MDITGHTCWYGTCVEPAIKEFEGNYYCRRHWIDVLKNTVTVASESKNASGNGPHGLQPAALQSVVTDVQHVMNRKAITVEFCMWLQDTDVFSAFTDHLNKGLRLEDLDINSVQIAETKMKKAGA